MSLSAAARRSLAQRCSHLRRESPLLWCHRSSAPQEHDLGSRRPPQPWSSRLRSRAFSSPSAASEQDKPKISVTFVDKNGSEKSIQVPVGMSMLEAAHENEIELEGACEGSLACSTCHVIFMDEELYQKLPEPSDEENDMLDLAFGLTETSRLGCQIIAKPELDGMRLALPPATRNFAVDGHVPKPH
ncbi:adrenodoxin-like protein 2, mitochondrial [Selaginella moellendorffii]|nr:adrenodoxin-like protein 2, mitochondrial [Selaginella moellendorffii]|eukprot:XP_002984046.2 adrenodoxin-like protein 2, mitochondrial [Selaginella moellendorffii]